MTTVVDGNGTVFIINDNNGQVVEAIATNSDGSTYTTQWDTLNETNWVSRTEWDNAEGGLTQAEVTFRDGSTGWEFFAADGSMTMLGNVGAMRPNADQSVFADIIGANLNGNYTAMGFQAGTGLSGLSGEGLSGFSAVNIDQYMAANLPSFKGTWDALVNAGKVATSVFAGVIGGKQAWDIVKDLIAPASSPGATEAQKAALNWALDQYGATYGANYDGHLGIGPVGPNDQPVTGPGGLFGHL